MDWPRAKTILLILLLALNLFLLGILLNRQIEHRRLLEEETKMLKGVLEQAGYVIEIPIPPVNEPASFTFTRDRQAERSAAEALLGNVLEELPLSVDGSSNLYRCEFGEAMFSAGPLFDITPYESVKSDNIRLFCEEWARGLLPENSNISLSREEGGYRLSAEIDGYPAWDEGIFFSLEGDTLKSVSGRWPIGMRLNHSGVADSAFRALLKLSESFENERPGKLLNIELGYYSEVASPEISVYVPHWRITLPTGEFLVNASNGNIMPAS